MRSKRVNYRSLLVIYSTPQLSESPPQLQMITIRCPSSLMQQNSSAVLLWSQVLHFCALTARLRLVVTCHIAGQEQHSQFNLPAYYSVFNFREHISSNCAQHFARLGRVLVSWDGRRMCCRCRGISVFELRRRWWLTSLRFLLDGSVMCVHKKLVGAYLDAVYPNWNATVRRHVDHPASLDHAIAVPSAARFNSVARQYIFETHRYPGFPLE